MMMMTCLCVDGVVVGERVGVPGGLGSGKPQFFFFENGKCNNKKLHTENKMRCAIAAEEYLPPEIARMMYLN